MGQLNGDPATSSSTPTRERKRPKTIVVEGNIGSGKTTFLDLFKDRPDVFEIMAEPVDKWRNCQGHNLLDKMYTDPKRYSLLFQTYVQLTMLQQHTAAQKAPRPVRIMERSLLRHTSNLLLSSRWPFRKIELC